jgi:TolA-binding protein
MGVIRATAAVLALVCAPGCFWVTTKDEGNLLRKDVTSLQERMARQEQSVDSRVKQLDESLDKATKLLARNSADVGSDVEKLGKDQATINGQVQDMQRQVEAMRGEVESLKAENSKLRADVDTKLAAPPPGTTPTPPGGTVTSPGGAVLDKDALFARAKKSFDDGQIRDARRDYADFVKRFPKDARADDAQVAIAETYYREKNLDQAVNEFQKVFDVYADSDQADKALFRCGEVSLELKRCVDARAYFATLVQKYPKSTLVKPSKAKLEAIKKNLKKKDVCPT